MELVPVPERTQGVAARALWRERNLASLALSVHADVALTPVPELPFRRLPVPSVIVAHDVGPLVAPAFYSPAKKLRYRAFLPRTCAVASAVVCVSEATLEDLLAVTATNPRRCEVIGEGPQLLDGAPERPSADEPYLLYVGSLEPRKNVDTLVDAFAAAHPPLPARLLIAGPTDARSAGALRRRLIRRGLEDRVQQLGFVSPQQLEALYRDALALVLPSLYEGFGLPVLEAMKGGTPVVASDIPPLREVADDAALYVSRPLDVEAWRGALVQICSDASLRAELSRHGTAAAARFSWPEVGLRFSDLLHRVAATGTLASPALRSTDTDEGLRRARVPSGIPAGAEPPE
jgi:glycosyltransferase involved in cell wall biosynthesis